MSTIIWFNTKFRKIGMGTIVGMGLIPIATGTANHQDGSTHDDFYFGASTRKTKRAHHPELPTELYNERSRRKDWLRLAWLGGNALKAQLGKEPSVLALLVLLGEHLQHMRTLKGEKRALDSRLLWRSPCASLCAWLGP